MTLNRAAAILAGFLVALSPAGLAATSYKLPPKSVIEILDAPGAPLLRESPAGDAILLVEIESNPPLSLVAEPFLRLGGVRLTPKRGTRQHLVYGTGLTLLTLPEGAERRVELPPGSRIGLPAFSPDGGTFAFMRDTEDRSELWIGETKTARARPYADVRLDDVLGEAMIFSGDGRSLLLLVAPPGRGPAPPEPAVPAGPVIEETSGKAAQVATYQDLLRNTRDEELFQHYGTSQVVRLDLATGRQTAVGTPGLHKSVEPSPDGKFLLVTRLRKPFSYRVPYGAFPTTIEIWDAAGKLVRTVAELPLADQTPRQGVPPGARDVQWQPMEDATLLYVEALDGGDPLRKVPFRESLKTWAAPFSDAPREARKLVHRFRGAEWTSTPGRVLVTEFDRDRRWRTTSIVDLSTPEAGTKPLFDLSAQDAYGDPGRFVLATSRRGRRTLLMDGDSAWLAGEGASPKGSFPFLDRIDLASGRKSRLFRSEDDAFERFVAFVGESRSRIVTRRETKTEPPNLWLVDLETKKRTRLTDVKDPAPQLAGVTKEILKYERADKVPLSGTLYLPPAYKPGTRLPCFVWAYPLEYSDADTAGQVRLSPNSFTRLSGASPLFFLTQGWAVLMDATMPVVGDPEHMNDTYVEQIAASAKATLDALDARGVVDRKRVVVGGHSYGAFMTANLLAHTDLFAAGIARSGAYNRSLTPFGFQSERRNYWEATDVYTKVSPFTYANRIKTPILLIHGEADSNSGTFPIQSERLFAAIQGTGGTARLVILPAEAHGYRARESVLHTLAEMLEWGEKWTRDKGQAAAGGAGR
jgi:dipeptidyl aminopeptidase/acylaminoacyl peptidase